MRFRVFIASTLAVMSFTGSAGDMGDTSIINIFDGPYIGAGTSIVNMFADTSIYNNPGNQGIIPLTLGTLQFQAASGFSAVAVRANLGYGKTFNNAGYIGAEVSYRYAPVRGGTIVGSNGNTTSYVNGRPLNDVGISLRGGYLFVPGVLTYGLIGINGTHFNYNFTDFVSVNHPFDKTQYGATPGIGIEVSLSSAVTMDLRYTYTAYSQASHEVKANIVIDNGDNYDLFNVTPTVQAANLTINYHFG